MVEAISDKTGIPANVIARRLGNENVTMRVPTLSVSSGILVVGGTEYEVTGRYVTVIPVLRTYRLELQLRSGSGEGSLVIHGFQGRAIGELILGDQFYRVLYKLDLQKD